MGNINKVNEVKCYNWPRLYVQDKPILLKLQWEMEGDNFLRLADARFYLM